MYIVCLTNSISIIETPLLFILLLSGFRIINVRNGKPLNITHALVNREMMKKSDKA